MHLPERFCFCFTLKTGGIFVGWLGTFGCLCHLVIWYLLFTRPDKYQLSLKEYEEICPNKWLLAALCASILLILGARTDNHTYLFPWLIWNVCLIIRGIQGMYELGNEPSIHGHKHVDIRFLIGFGIPAVMLCIYYWLCIFSLYSSIKLQKQKLKEEIAVTQIVEHPPLFPRSQSV